MSKKDKIKKWLKENYKSLIGKIILVLFALLVIFSQIKNCCNYLDTNTTSSSQPIKRLHLDTNNNLVSDNLLNTDKTKIIINNSSDSLSLNLESDTQYNCWLKFKVNTYSNSESVIFSNVAGGVSSLTDDIVESKKISVSAGNTYLFKFSFTTPSTFKVFEWRLLRNNAFGNQGLQLNADILEIGLFKGLTSPTTFEPYGLIYYSQNYIDEHYVSKQENDTQKENAYNEGYNKGLDTNLKSALIDLLDINEIDGVYAYDSNNNVDYSINYFNSDDYIRVDNIPSKKGLVIQYKRPFNVDTLRFSIPSTDFIANDNWEYIYFKVYLYNSNIQSFTNLDVFTSDTTSSSLYINGVFNGKVSFDKIYIGFDFLSSISYTFESISLNSQVSHIYTDYYDTIFQLGYNEAVSSGESFKNGYSEGFKDGEKSGIYQGQLMQTHFTLGDIMKSVISAPVEVLGVTLDFDIPGTNINIFSVVRLVITCLVIAFAVKFLRG